MVPHLLLTTLIALAVLTLALIIEALIHRQRLSRIQIRISVTGTRGKTTTVRLLASVMREAGYRVLAKTTGSEARFILPDGSEEPVKRRGRPNIIEQKKVIRKALALDCEAVVAEIMSIQPENHRTETRHLIRPTMTLITNLRADHLDAAGPTLSDQEKLYKNDLFPGAINLYGEQADQTHSVELVTRAAQHLGISMKQIEAGIQKAKMDLGEAKMFRIANTPVEYWFINAFAANDPLSTHLLMHKFLKETPVADPRIVALLSLRSDRGERSEQWMQFMLDPERNSREWPGMIKPILIERIYILGTHGSILHRRFKRTKNPGFSSRILKNSTPEKIIQTLISDTNRPTLCFGIGNIHGPGTTLLHHLLLTP